MRCGKQITTRLGDPFVCVGPVASTPGDWRAIAGGAPPFILGEPMRVERLHKCQRQEGHEGQCGWMSLNEMEAAV